MPHWRTLTNEKWLKYYHIEGRDRTVTITEMKKGEVRKPNGEKDFMPVALLEETDKELGLNKTNCKTISEIYGTTDYTQWIGKKITIYATTTTKRGGEVCGCIRVRPKKPPEKKEAPSEAAE